MVPKPEAGSEESGLSCREVPSEVLSKLIGVNAQGFCYRFSLSFRLTIKTKTVFALILTSYIMKTMTKRDRVLQEALVF